MISNYHVVHETVYDYGEPVPICQNELRMRPRSSAMLNCKACEISISPKPETLLSYVDYFGNEVDSFAIESPHRQLKVRVASDIGVYSRDDTELGSGPRWRDVADAIAAGGDGEDWTAAEFVHASRRIGLDDQYVSFARDIFADEADLIIATEALTKRIHQTFAYDPTATGVDTSTEDAFEIRAGVCQDFSHVQIACLRSIGIPARYVSGYLRTIPPPGKPRLVGADQSHAWISVYAGRELGWIDYDPTNACRTASDHIPVCLGRDYDDISPMRGIVIGGGDTVLKVSVDVIPDEPAGGQSQISQQMDGMSNGLPSGD
ncbi:MAG: transglutaminase family protein [Planctomycetota bacterium]